MSFRKGVTGAMNNNIKRWFKENQAKAARLLQALVQENSIRMNESSAQAIIIEKCRQLGLKLDIWEIGDEYLFRHPAYKCNRKDFDGYPNVVAVLKGSGGGKSIILNSHIDVATVGDAQSWIYEPFSGQVEAGKLYGRGSSDMKGGTVALLMAMEALIAMGVRLRGDIIFQSVIEEESGGAGTLSTVLRGYKADAVIIPGPTNMKITLRQEGSLDEQHPLVGILSSSYRQIIKQHPVIEASSLGTDGDILSTIGHIPVVVFGPGLSTMAHNTNEHIILDDLFITSEIIALTLMKWCEIAE